MPELRCRSWCQDPCAGCTGHPCGQRIRCQSSLLLSVENNDVAEVFVRRNTIRVAAGQIQDTSALQCHELRSIRVGEVRTEMRTRFQVFHHDGRTVQQPQHVQVLQNVSNGRVTSGHTRTCDLSYGVFKKLVTHS